MTMETVERVISELAGRQHGVVARQQLLEAGLGPDVVDRRVRSGRLQPLHRGVYATATPRSPHAIELAARLACGRWAVVSHRSAAGLWGLLPPRSPSEPVDIALTRGNRSRPGIRVRRLRTIHPDEVTKVHGVEVTVPARTVLDLAATEAPRVVEQALAQALARGLVRPSKLHLILDRHAGESGARGLAAVLQARGIGTCRIPAAARSAPRSPDRSHPSRPATGLTRSEAEERFLELVRAGHLPEPETNARVLGYEVDCLWRSAKLIVEIDGFAYHASRNAFEADRRRDADLAAAGFRVVRVTWRQLVQEREAVLVRLTRALTAAVEGHR